MGATPEAGDRQDCFPGSPVLGRCLISAGPRPPTAQDPSQESALVFSSELSGPRTCLGPAPLLTAHPASGQTSHGPPWLGAIPWAGSGSLCPTDTQVCRVPHVTQGFLRFLPGGRLSEGLLPHGSGKPKWMQGKILAKQESLPPGAGCRGSWPSRHGVVLMPAPHVAHGRLPLEAEPTLGCSGPCVILGGPVPMSECVSEPVFYPHS